MQDADKDRGKKGIKIPKSTHLVNEILKYLPNQTYHDNIRNKHAQNKKQKHDRKHTATGKSLYNRRIYLIPGFRIHPNGFPIKHRSV